MTKKLIPRKVIFSDPEKSLPKISPDGKWIGYLAPNEDNLNLWLAPIDNINKAKPITSSQHPIRDFWWANTNDHILYIHDHFGDENWQLSGYQLSKNHKQFYTPSGFQVRIFYISNTKPESILIGLNDRDKRFHDVYYLNIITGELTIAYQNHQYWDFLADDDLNVKIAVKIVEKKGEYYDISQKEPRLVARVAINDLFSMYFYPQLRPRLSHDANNLFISHSMESNTSTLYSYDLKNNTKQSLGVDPTADIYDVLYDKKSNMPLAYATYYERRKWHPFEANTKQHFDVLENLDDGDIEITSQSDNAEWIVGFIHDNGPVRYYHYDCKNQKAQFVFDSHSGFQAHHFVKMHPKVITTRDGTKCVSYLSLPFQRQHPVPLVILVHGGPNFRDFWGFNATHQWLANRGYAVLSVNYRASTGFGKSHFEAGHGEWAGKIHEDILDALKWAVDEKITTEDNVAIMGRSFGGYEALVGLSMTPDVFACGIDLVGPANLETMVKNFPPYWKAMKGAIDEMVGCDPNTEEGKAYLRERSPLFYAHNIKKPLIIGHGANDIRVLQSESDALVKTMRSNNIPVTYVLFPDEGHQLMHPGNRVSFYALVEAFLAKSLGGQVEPFDKAVHTSMVMKVDDFHLLERK